MTCEPDLLDAETKRRRLEDRTWEAATAFAVLGAATLVLALIGLPILAVGAFAFAFDGVTWPVAAGSILLAAAAGMGWFACRWFRKWRAHHEAPKWRNQVFISYRTAEHASFAERVQKSLQAAGVGVFLAKSGDLEVDPSPARPSPWVLFRVLGLYQTGQLDADLQRHLVASSAVLYFVPTTKRRLGLWQRMKDSIDALFSLLLFQSGLTLTSWRFMWYVAMYEQSMVPAARLFDLQSWQAWELGLARQLGLPVVRLRVSEGAEENDDADLVTCAPESLEEELLRKALPRLRDAPRRELKLRGPLPVMALAVVGFFTLQSAALLSLAGVGVFLLARAVL